jgi:hypothetical protein
MQFLNLNPTFARIGLSNALIPRKWIIRCTCMLYLYI